MPSRDQINDAGCGGVLFMDFGGIGIGCGSMGVL